MRRAGFTLVELLVVILIILLVSALVLPQVLPAIAHREVSEAARILQAGLVQARSAAVGVNAPRGIRLLPDPTYASRPSILAFNRWVPIEPGPDYSNGMATVWPVPITAQVFTSTPPYPIENPDGSISPYPYYPIGSPNSPCFGQVLMVEQAPFAGNDSTSQPNNPTSWFWNVRVGDKIQVGDFGQTYTVVGPMTVANPELFVNDGQPGTVTQLTRTYSDPFGNNPQTVNVEYLFLVNGKDDDQDGFIDQGFDGLDNGRSLPNGQFVGMDGVIDSVMEWEPETWLSTLAGFNTPSDAIYLSGNSITTPTVIRQPMPYVVSRRPVVSPGATETTLPRDIVIDATSWSTTRERSRLPIDPTSHYVDILLDPSGLVIVQTVYSSPSSIGESGTFFHFWLSERADLFETVATPNVPYQLPMPGTTVNYPATADPSVRLLTGERMIVTLFGRTGQITANSIEFFDGGDVNRPFYDAQLGAREAK